MIRAALVVATLAVTSASFAGDRPRPIDPAMLVDHVAFDWAVGPGKCKKVDPALQKKIDKGYICMPQEEGTGSASGKPIAAVCKAKKGRSEYLVFKEMADCKLERDTQLANGE